MSKPTPHDSINILGVHIDAITNAEAIAHILARTAPGQPPSYITKPYVEFLDRAYQQPKLQSLLNQAELTLADGVALLWAAHYLYAGPRNIPRFWLTLCQIVLAPAKLRWPLVDRTAGINFTWPLLQQAAAQGRSVYLIASPRGSTVEATARHLTAKIPGLTIAGTRDGHDPAASPGAVTDTWLADTAAAITTARPDIILVGMGFPLQEGVCAYLSAHTAHGIYIGEGGTFDYEQFGGHRPKAPAAIQRIGLEWFWRLILEPQQLRRQLAIPRFIWRIWKNR